MNAANMASVLMVNWQLKINNFHERDGGGQQYLYFYLSSKNSILLLFQGPVNVMKVSEPRIVPWT